MAEEIKNCPCQKNSGLVTSVHMEWNMHDKTFRVACSSCRRATGWFVTRQEAIKSWNKLVKEKKDVNFEFNT